MAGLAAVAEERIYFRTHQYLAREADLPVHLYQIDEGWACRFRLLSDGRRSGYGGSESHERGSIATARFIREDGDDNANPLRR